MFKNIIICILFVIGVFSLANSEPTLNFHGQTCTLTQLLKDLTCRDCDYHAHNRSLVWLGNSDNPEILRNESVIKGVIGLIDDYNELIKARMEKIGKNEKLLMFPDEDYRNYLFALSFAAGKFNDDRFIEPLLKMNSESVLKYREKAIESILKYYDASPTYPGTSKWALIITLKKIIENNSVSKELMDKVVSRFLKELGSPDNKQNFRLRIIMLLGETKNPSVIPELLKYKNEIFRMEDEIIDGKKVSYNKIRERNRIFYHRIEVKPGADGSKIVKLFDRYLKVKKNGNIYEYETGGNGKTKKGNFSRLYYPDIFKDTVEQAVKKLEKYSK